MPDYVYAIIGTSIIFAATTLGSALVFFFGQKGLTKKVGRIFTGFASGVMLSAAFFGLLKPAIFESNVTYMPASVIAGISVLLGALFLWGIDKLVPHLHSSNNKEEGIKTRHLNKDQKMFLAVTIHNIPEGLSVGVAFGVALANPGNNTLLMGALFLAVGIGIQNVTEGAAVSLPVKADTGKSMKAFLFGMFSGIVEPIAAVIGLFFAMQIQEVMPWALSFAAGCMIYVVAEEMIPEIKENEHDHFGVWAFIIGFITMMLLDCIQF